MIVRSSIISATFYYSGSDMDMEKYYLSSLDSHLFEEVRECKICERFILSDNRQLIIGIIKPSVIIQNKYFDKIAMINRYENESLIPILKFPCFVNVLIDPQMGFENIDWVTVNLNDFQFIAICELYQTKENAQKHIF